MSATAEEQIATPLPTPFAVRECFGDLVGKEVTVGNGSPVPVNYANDCFVAVYVDDRRRMGALCVLDLPLGGHLGGALGLLPVPLITAGIDENNLPETAVECVFEVLNVAASLFNAPGAPHLKIDSLVKPGDKVPLDVLALANALGRRLDLKANVAGYGSGYLSFVLGR